MWGNKLNPIHDEEEVKVMDAFIDISWWDDDLRKRHFQTKCLNHEFKSELPIWQQNLCEWRHLSRCPEDCRKAIIWKIWEIIKL